MLQRWVPSFSQLDTLRTAISVRGLLAICGMKQLLSFWTLSREIRVSNGDRGKPCMFENASVTVGSAWVRQQLRSTVNDLIFQQPCSKRTVRQCSVREIGQLHSIHTHIPPPPCFFPPPVMIADGAEKRPKIMTEINQRLFSWKWES